MVLMTIVKVHRIPPLYNNGGGHVSIKYSYHNWTGTNPHVKTKITIFNSLGKEELEKIYFDTGNIKQIQRLNMKN